MLEVATLRCLCVPHLLLESGSYYVSKCSLCVSLVDRSHKHDWCSSSVSFWCLSDCVVINYVGYVVLLF